MNPFDLTASDLLIWGLVAHLIADWPLQNDWMANNKALRGRPGTLSDPLALERQPWWLRHPAAFVHAAVHLVLLALVFGWWPALALAFVHLLIDTRTPVVWWSRLVRQTQPTGEQAVTWHDPKPLVVVDIGTEVRFWTDQVFHIACIAVAALVVA